MDAFIYCRTNTLNKRTPRHSQWKAQEDRCKIFAHENGLTYRRTYFDEGFISPETHRLGWKKLLNDLAMQGERTAILCDHPARLSLQLNLRLSNIAMIEDLGGVFASVFADPYQQKQ